jgi:hypothetical protein
MAITAPKSDRKLLLEHAALWQKLAEEAEKYKGRKNTTDKS